MKKGEVDRTAVLQEAIALEKLGAKWTIYHVSALTGYSRSFLYRRADLPRKMDRDSGRVFYEPEQVRSWWNARLTMQQAG